MTQSFIDNTGINLDDMESSESFAVGLFICSLYDLVSNWRCSETLSEYIGMSIVMSMSYIDTRAITVRLREDGSLIAVLTTYIFGIETIAISCLLYFVNLSGSESKDLITDLSRSKSYELKDNTDLEWEFNADSGAQRLHMVAYGFGAKNIVRNIASHGYTITVVPSANLSSEVLNLKPDGMLFSNGPGGQSAVPYAVKIVQDLVGEVPGFGICVGHQQLGQALGGSTFKTNFGHHDGNHPVRRPAHLPTGRVKISAQLIRRHCQKLLN